MTLAKKATRGSRVKEIYMKAAAQMSVEDVQQMCQYIDPNSGRNSRRNSGKTSCKNGVENGNRNASANTCSDSGADATSGASGNTCADSGAGVSADTAPDSSGRTRQKQSHDWPEIGTVLHAEYFGQKYRATVIKANKKLLSGRQVKLQNGHAAGEVCDSLSAAMLKATESQRLHMRLRRKGVANGWDFWQWDGK